jgi:hypothetical protein
MATIADYVVVADGTSTLVRGGTNFVVIDFNLPSNIVTAQRGILMYRMEVEDPDDLHYHITINNKEVVSFIHNSDRFGTVHEVIDANVLQFGSNTLSAVANGGDGTVKISDIVVHFQATV